MSNNQNLGYYDMVLSLSQNKINSEFKLLYEVGEISPELQVMTNLSGSLNMNSLTEGFKEKKTEWLKLDQLNTDLVTVDQEIATISGQLVEAIDEGKFEEAAKLNKKIKPRAEDKKKLEAKLSGLQNYQLLIDAVILSPEIEILDRENYSVLFKLTFDQGHLYYLENGKLNKTDLKNKVYSFNVPIGKVRITADEMLLLGDRNKVLRKSGLSDHDFTIESIFLNFNNASISNFDESRSILPAAQQEKTFLQLAVTNYFKELANDNNPFILGYALQNNNVKSADPAMLYPTGASFSTSKSSQSRASSFNFLMHTDNNGFSSAGNSGILKENLIEKTIDKTPSVNGAIAINYTTFNSIYLQQLNKTVMENFHASFKEKQTQAYDGSEKHDGFNRFLFSKDGLRMNFDIADPKLQNKIHADGSCSVELKYNITVKGNTHKEIDKTVMLFIDAGTVGVDQPFSTSGRYEIEGQTGSEGKLTLNLKASDAGKLLVSADYENPKVGRDTQDVVYKDKTDEYWDKLSDFINPFGTIIGLYSLFTNKGRQIVEFDQSTFKSVNFKSLDSFSSKVILPGSNTYTFKNVRLMNGTLSHEDAILFDIAYVPTINA